VGDDRPVVLSVDDDKNILESIEKTLSELDIEIITASSGKEGLEVLNARRVDVVISDMRMPEMSGSEFLKEVVELQPHSRRIVLTRDADSEEAKSAINEGGVSLFLDIPWKDKELRQIIGEAVKTARLARDNVESNELTRAQNAELQSLNAELEEQLATRTQELDHSNGLLSTALTELEETHELMVGLAANIAAMPNLEGDDARSKLKLAFVIGAELGLDDEDLLHLKSATRLHKLGWVGVPKRVTSKPLATLSVADRLAFEKHTAYAEAVLLNIPRLRQASEIISNQHEHFNGHGFPAKRAGDGIPLAARILAVARDYYDLMAGGVEKKELTPAEAVAHIVAEADDAYDADVVKVFQSVVKTIDELDPSLDEMSVRTLSLQPDMRLARDLRTNEDVVLLAKGTTLSEDMIASLITLERRSDKELQIFVCRVERQEVEAK
jgi:adenylate cyclase